MDEMRFLTLARKIMSLPTATYHEHLPMRMVRAFAAARPGIQLRQDDLGNTLMFYRGRGTGSRKEPLMMTAHLDHPGLAYAGRHSDTCHLFDVLGGVDVSLLPGSAVRIYTPGADAGQRSVRGRIREIIGPGEDAGRRVKVQVPGKPGRDPGPGSFAMWDLIPFRHRGRRLHGRACDDLAGVAVGLAVLDELRYANAKTDAGLLLTRAEEIGFDGMIGALRGSLIQRNAIYINIECSSVTAGAEMGAGPVIRVGDRQSVFDPLVLGGLVAVANDLDERKHPFRYQRRLMDAGSCEATALMHAGLKTGAVALPLGNYHNGGKKCLRPEVVDLDDALNLVQLLVAAATHPEGLMGANRRSQRTAGKAMNRRLARSRKRLRQGID